MIEDQKKKKNFSSPGKTFIYFRDLTFWGCPIFFNSLGEL